MAYPTVEAPYGLRPVNLTGGQVFAGSTRLVPIASGYDTSIYYGDVVTRVADGTIEKDSGTVTVAPLGVFLGCEYTDPNTGYLLHSQHYPANTVATDIKAYVCDDPDAIFKVAVVSTGTTIEGTPMASIGANAALVQNAGNDASGNSAVAINGVATTETLPVKIIDGVAETVDGSGNFTEVLVRWNAGMHLYDSATGV